MSSEVPAAPNRPHGFWRRHGLKLAVSIVIGGAFVWTMERGGLPLVPPAAAFKKVQISNCIAYMALLIGWHAVRALRWRHLLAPIADIPLRRILAVSWIGFAAILIMPLRAGEFVRPYMIREKGKGSMAAATGT